MKILNASRYLMLLAPLSLQTMDAPKKKTVDTDLISAVMSNDLARVKSILKMPGVDVNALDYADTNALHYAAGLSGILTTDKEKNDNIAIIRLLLDRPEIDVNVYDGTGKTALDLCLKGSRPSRQVKTLLRYSGAKTSAELERESLNQKKYK